MFGILLPVLAWSNWPKFHARVPGDVRDNVWYFWLTMVGTNLTFFLIVILGYLGMPRRYATYAISIGPVELFSLLHQLATAGVLLLVFGQIIFLWNIASSWLYCPAVTDSDPWDLQDSGLYSRE